MKRLCESHFASGFLAVAGAASSRAAPNAAISLSFELSFVLYSYYFCRTYCPFAIFAQRAPEPIFPVYAILPHAAATFFVCPRALQFFKARLPFAMNPPFLAYLFCASQREKPKAFAFPATRYSRALFRYLWNPLCSAGGASFPDIFWTYTARARPDKRAAARSGKTECTPSTSTRTPNCGT